MDRLFEIWPGGVAEIAREIGAPYQTVAAWKRRGVPLRRAPAILRAARAKGHDLTLDDLLDECAAAPTEKGAA